MLGDDGPFSSYFSNYYSSLPKEVKACLGILIDFNQ